MYDSPPNGCNQGCSCKTSAPYWFRMGAPGFWFPERCFWFPWCFFSRNGVFGSREGLVVPRVFSVPGLGCFQFPDSGLMFPEWCVGRPWVFSVPGMVFPVHGQRGRHGGVCGSRTVFRVPMRVPPLLRCFFLRVFLLLLASSCFSAFLCFLASFLPPTFPHFLRFCLASCLFSFLSSVPAFPLPSLPPPALPLIFFRSFLFLLPALASFPSLPFPFLSFLFLSFLFLPFPSLPFPNSLPLPSLP